MLSATVGSLDDVVVGEFDSAPKVASPDFFEEGIGLPSGVSLLVCPVSNWSESGSGHLAPTSAIETDESLEPHGSFSTVSDDSGLLVCTFPPATFSLSGDADFSDSIARPAVDPGVDGGQDTFVDPTIIVDPVITDPPKFEPLDIRVQFVSSDPGRAAYYYSVGSDGSVYVWVLASYDEQGIAEFVSGDSQARAYATVEDAGDGWVVWNFPVDLAPPVPESGVFAMTGCIGPADGWSDDGSISPKDPTLMDGTDPILYVCDGYPLPREYCVLPTPFDATSIDEAARSDSGVGLNVRAYSTSVENAQTRTAISPTNNVPYGWMVAFGSNLSGAGGESLQPVTGRRRSR